MQQTHTKGIWIAQVEEDREILEEFLVDCFSTVKFARLELGSEGKPPRIRYLSSSLAQDGTYIGAVKAWVEPANWTPTWRVSPVDTQEVELTNHPTTWVELGPILRPSVKQVERITPYGDRYLCEYQNLNYIYIGGSWSNPCKEQMDLINFTIKIAKRSATNKTIVIDYTTGRPRQPPASRGMIWIAEHTTRWLREAPNRFVHDSLRLADEYETYIWPLPQR